jgi:hypothetical protein
LPGRSRYRVSHIRSSGVVYAASKGNDGVFHVLACIDPLEQRERRLLAERKLSHDSPVGGPNIFWWYAGALVLDRSLLCQWSLWQCLGAVLVQRLVSSSVDTCADCTAPGLGRRSRCLQGSCSHPACWHSFSRCHRTPRTSLEALSCIGASF